MDNRLHSIYDRKSGTFGVPFASFNNDTAKRDFIGFCKQPQNAYLADDLELYYVGTFCSRTGEVKDLPAKPEFILAYGGVLNE